MTAEIAKSQTRNTLCTSVSSVVNDLRFYDFAAAQAGGTDAQLLRGALHARADRLQVDVPAASAYVVRVTDGVSELRPSAADLTNSCQQIARTNS